MCASSPLLMNAILAVSALHLSRVSDLDSYEAVRYHDRCLGLMVPMLDDPERIKDDNLLMTTVILHLYEDLDSMAPRLLARLGTRANEQSLQLVQILCGISWQHRPSYLHVAVAFHPHYGKLSFGCIYVKRYIPPVANNARFAQI